MRVIALLALLFGFMAQMLLDGQVFTHAVFGIVCGGAAVGCGLASARKDHPHRLEGRIMAGLGFALGVWCIVVLPSSYGQQERFNDRTQKYREKLERQNQTPTALEPTATAYLKLKGLKLGYLLNFGANLMRDGIERIVNGLPEENLGVSASLRETKTQAEPNGAANAAPPHR